MNEWHEKWSIRVLWDEHLNPAQPVSAIHQTQLLTPGRLSCADGSLREEQNCKDDNGDEGSEHFEVRTCLGSLPLYTLCSVGTAALSDQSSSRPQPVLHHKEREVHLQIFPTHSLAHVPQLYGFILHQIHTHILALRSLLLGSAAT
jgi:hypothetical protein